MEYYLVSIIVPVYNVAQYLRKCLDSICSQTYSHIEIILVNDGSTDNSLSICEEYSKNDERIVLIHKRNGGLSSARNAGIDIHKGSFILFVDSDDHIHPDMVGDLLGIALKEEADIVECGCCYVKEGENPRWGKVRKSYHVYPGEDALENCLDYVFKIVAWNKLYRTELFHKIRFPEGKLHEDEFTIPYVLEQCNKYVRTDNRYYAYVQRKNSIMSSAFHQDRLIILTVFPERLEHFRDRYTDIITFHYFIKTAEVKQQIKKDPELVRIHQQLKCKCRELYKQCMVSGSYNMKRLFKLTCYFLMPSVMLLLRKHHFKN